jgi:hypothetical protein
MFEVSTPTYARETKYGILPPLVRTHLRQPEPRELFTPSRSPMSGRTDSPATSAMDASSSVGSCVRPRARTQGSDRQWWWDGGEPGETVAAAGRIARRGLRGRGKGAGRRSSARARCLRDRDTPGLNLSKKKTRRGCFQASQAAQPAWSVHAPRLWLPPLVFGGSAMASSIDDDDASMLGGPCPLY